MGLTEALCGTVETQRRLKTPSRLYFSLVIGFFVYSLQTANDQEAPIDPWRPIVLWLTPGPWS
jgi:hypothetical protein